MATISGSTQYLSSHFAYYITWSESSVNSTNNTSVVTASVYVQKIGSYSVESSQNSHSLWIDGTQFTANPYVDMNPETTPRLLVSGSKTITHNSDGSKSITISSSGEVCHIDPRPSYTPYTGSASGTATLTTITRATAVTTSDASSVGGTSATVGGNVTDAGIPTCTSRGVYWGTTSGSQPNKLTSGSGGGSFNANISGLERGTTYYFKAFSYNSSGYRYGTVKSFTTTAAAPSVTTGSASSIGVYTATVAGNVTDDNGAAVTERGVCYNTTGTPTISDSKVTTGGGEGAFSENLSGLTPNTHYYCRAYAINAQGTSYGSVVEFDTLVSIPSLTTDAGATGITTSVATVSGEVTSDNGAVITERGFVYGLSENPTIANSKAIVSGTTGEMEKELTGLQIATTYHFRPFATNSEGTGYGTDSTFTTLPGNPSGLSATRTDKDSVYLTWTKGNGGTYSIIRRGEVAPANINSETLIYQSTGTSFTDTGLDAGTTYYYRVWSATTADWSEAYSAGYSADYDTTIYDFINTSYALVDDVNPATVPTNDGVLRCQVSRDGGTTWSTAKELTYTASITTQDFGDGSTELWGMMTWNGDHVNDTNFRIKIIGSSDDKSYQIFKNFGFSVNSSYILTGIRVQAKAAFDGTDLLVYFIKVDVYYGDSPLPVGEGSLAYDTTLDRPTYYDGGDWTPIGGGSKVTVAETAPSDPKFGDIWVDISSD